MHKGYYAAFSGFLEARRGSAVTEPRRYVLTGAQGTGKTTLVEALGRRGHPVIREAGIDRIASAGTYRTYRARYDVTSRHLSRLWPIRPADCVPGARRAHRLGLPRGAHVAGGRPSWVGSLGNANRRRRRQRCG
ncbi:AAA family ATPase [Micromonospora sp. NPDC005553]|uniref:AAA family ATPase n=1 Tax=Micromonospora sp. NPDC005553 TaxID=3364232 RepID=UPI0036752FDC